MTLFLSNQSMRLPCGTGCWLSGEPVPVPCQTLHHCTHGHLSLFPQQQEIHLPSSTSRDPQAFLKHTGALRRRYPLSIVPASGQGTSLDGCLFHQFQNRPIIVQIHTLRSYGLRAPRLRTLFTCSGIENSLS